jgi:tight adherence protein B
MSAESRVSSYVIGAMPIVLLTLMYLINPKVIGILFTDPRGKVILGIAIFLLLSGFALMAASIKKAAR